MESRLGLIYRAAFGYANRVLHLAGPYADPETVPIDPAEAVPGLDPATAEDPEVLPAILDGIADARAGRQPRW